jgi:hypothetical protein
MYLDSVWNVGTGLRRSGDTIFLNYSGVTPGAYGDATHVFQGTVDSFGRITSATSVPITGGGGGGGVSSFAGRTGPVVPQRSDYAGYYLDSAQASPLIGDSLAANSQGWQTAGQVDMLISDTATTLRTLQADSMALARILLADTSSALRTLIGRYLPLSGGTLTGPLGGTSATFSNSVTGIVLTANRTASDAIGAGPDVNIQDPAPTGSAWTFQLMATGSNLSLTSLVGGTQRTPISITPTGMISAQAYATTGGTSSQLVSGTGSLVSPSAFDVDSARASHIADTAKRSGWALYADSARVSGGGGGGGSGGAIYSSSTPITVATTTLTSLTPSIPTIPSANQGPGFVYALEWDGTGSWATLANTLNQTVSMGGTTLVSWTLAGTTVPYLQAGGAVKFRTDLRVFAQTAIGATATVKVKGFLEVDGGYYQGHPIYQRLNVDEVATVNTTAANILQESVQWSAAGGNTLTMDQIAEWLVTTQTTASFPPSGTASGDLSGSYPGPIVSGLLGHSLGSLTVGYPNWNGSAWVWTTPTGAVTSVFGRTGAVAATTGDYTAAQVGAEPAITAGTTAQYWRGDKSWQPFPTTWAWGSLTGIPANVTSFGSLANTAGALTNNGSGTFSYAAYVPAFTSAAENLFWATPNGASGVPSLRAIVNSDIPSFFGDVTGTINATAVNRINGVSLAGLATGLLKNLTALGTPSIAVGSDLNTTFGSQTANYFYAAPNGSAGNPSFRAMVAADVPTLNQSTTGTAANITATSNSTLTTLSVLSLPIGQVTGTINASQVNGAAVPVSKAFVGTNTSGQIIDATSTVITAAMEPAHTGDATNTAGSLAMTIPAGTVTLAKQANLAANSVEGNLTGSAATPVAVPASATGTASSVAVRDANGGLTSDQLSQAVQTIAVGTAISANLANGGTVLIGASGVPGALTAATTITFSNPLIGSTSRVIFKQGTTSFAVTFTISGYTFYQNGKTAGVASGSAVLLAADMTLSQYYTAAITWLSATTASVALLKS